VEQTEKELGVTAKIKFAYPSSEWPGHDKKKWVTVKDRVDSEYELRAEITVRLKEGHPLVP
jgi:hypothetical protein